MALVRMPFTDRSSEFLGQFPYFHFPNPQPPSVRSQSLPPVTAPAPGAWTRYKAGVPGPVTGTFSSGALNPSGTATYGNAAPVTVGTGGIIRTG